MNYQKIKLKGQYGMEVMVDFDSNRTKCRKCGTMIRFGIKADGTFMPISQNKEEWQPHFIDCIYQKQSNGREDAYLNEDKQQEYLNNL